MLKIDEHFGDAVLLCEQEGITRPSSESVHYQTPSKRSSQYPSHLKRMDM